MPDDHSDLEPLLPIPNRTVKQVSADDSAGSRVKVGHRQALIAPNPLSLQRTGGFCVGEQLLVISGLRISIAPPSSTVPSLVIRTSPMESIA